MLIGRKLVSYARFVKIEHTLFSLPIIYAAAILANQSWPQIETVLLILAAGLGARICALGLNRIIDRKIDALNPRTANRELPKRNMRLSEAWLITVSGGVVYLLSAKLLSDFCFKWSWLPLILFAIYPTLKRSTFLAHFGLGLAWACAPLGGWFAVSPSFKGSGPAFLMALFAFFWLSGFDMIYACLDEEFDRSHGVYSLPAIWGKKNALKVSLWLHLLSFTSLLALYVTSLEGGISLFFLGLCGLLLYLEHRLSDNVNLAFFKMNIGCGFSVLGMVWAGVR